MVSMLQKTRELNKILQKSATEPVEFSDICKILSDVMKCNVYVISKKGKILGHSLIGGNVCEVIRDKTLRAERFTDDYNNHLLQITETKANFRESGSCTFDSTIECPYKDKLTTVIPIIGNRERLGTLMITRYSSEFSDEDLILGEYSAAIVGMEIIKAKQDKYTEEERKKIAVQVACSNLSYSEIEALRNIFANLKGNEGLVVGSKVAEKANITRSIIVSSLRKIESAGIIESRSLGVKGTYIKILNDRIFEELEKLL